MRRVFLNLDESFSDMSSEIVWTLFFRDESKYFLIKESRFLDTADTDDDRSELDSHRLFHFIDIVDSIDREGTSYEKSDTDMLIEEKVSCDHSRHELYI